MRVRKAQHLAAAALALAVAVPAFACAQEPVSSPDIRKEAGVKVAMRDGVGLSTDLYFPPNAVGPVSTILIRTPYGKDREYPYGGMIPMFVEAGYAVAFQDTRGRYDSEGEFTVRFSDREDGYDVTTWLANQSWSNGKIATFGCSYRGETQITLAAERHPNHVAAIPMAPSAAYDIGGRPWTAFDGGAFELAQTAGWFMLDSSSDRLELYRGLPVVGVVAESGAVGTDYEDYASSTPISDYFRSLDFIRADDRFDVPALYVDSWYDFGVNETLQLFNQQRENALSARARDNQYVIVAPSTHCAWMRPANSRAGARDVGEWRLDFEDLYLRWYRYWLDGDDTRITEMARVQYYLMGANEWKSAEAWPIPGTEFVPFYLRGEGNANTRMGDGVLSTTAPGDELSDVLVYDPADPVPSLGGQACCTGISTGAGGYDQSEIETREDVLVYTSDVLDEGIEVTGPLQAFLYVTSDAPDTDFTMKLVDVYPDGTAYNIQEAARRMRFRDSLTESVLMVEGEVYEIRLDLHATSNYFGPGHRIRIEVSSSNFPRWSRNLNTGMDNHATTEWAIATNTVHHSAAYPSRIILPVVR